MSVANEKDEVFLNALSHELASEVLTDDSELEKALGPTRSALRDRVRLAAKRAIGTERRCCGSDRLTFRYFMAGLWMLWCEDCKR